MLIFCRDGTSQSFASPAGTEHERGGQESRRVPRKAAGPEEEGCLVFACAAQSSPRAQHTRSLTGSNPAVSDRTADGHSPQTEVCTLQENPGCEYRRKHNFGGQRSFLQSRWEWRRCSVLAGCQAVWEGMLWQLCQLPPTEVKGQFVSKGYQWHSKKQNNVQLHSVLPLWWRKFNSQA